MQQQRLETVIGGIVISIAVIFVFFAYGNAGVGKSTSGYNVLAQFNRVDGVNPGTDVRISGVKIGTVSALTLNAKTYMAEISLKIDSKVSLPRDTVAKIDSEGLLGGQYVALEPGGDEDMLKDGDKIAYTQSSPSLQSLIGQLVFSGAGGDKKQPEGSAAAPAATNPAMGTHP